MLKHSFKKKIHFFLSSLIVFTIVFFYIIESVFINSQGKKSLLDYKYSTSIKTLDEKYVFENPTNKYEVLSELNSIILFLIEKDKTTLRDAVNKYMKLNLDNINRTYQFNEKLGTNKVIHNFMLRRYGSRELILLHNEVKDVEQFKIFISSLYKKFFKEKYLVEQEIIDTFNFKKKNYEYYSEENLIKFNRWEELINVNKHKMYQEALDDLENLDNLFKFINFSEPEIINNSQVKNEILSINLLRFIIIIFLSYISSNILYNLKIRYFK